MLEKVMKKLPYLRYPLLFLLVFVFAVAVAKLDSYMQSQNTSQISTKESLQQQEEQSTQQPLLQEQEFRDLVQSNAIRSVGSQQITLDGGDSARYLVGLCTDGSLVYTEYTADLYNLCLLYGYDVQELTDGDKVESESGDGISGSDIIIVLLFIGIISLFGSSIVKSQESNKLDIQEPVHKQDIHLADVIGVGAKEDVSRVIDYIKNRNSYTEAGARAPKGIIFCGAPGTGKTMLAKAIACECGVSFFSACGSDFDEMYVGVGAKRIRKLYDEARKHAPSIVFIDEVDAIAGRRVNNTGNTESNRTLNALLAELDGINGSDNVVTICATNLIDELDEAFKRAGRFDLILTIPLPDRDSRQKILEKYTENKKLSKDIDLSDIVKQTVGFSGAELENLVNNATLLAVGSGRDEVSKADIEESLFKILLKGNKERRADDKTLRLIAYHEAGHVLATKLLTGESVQSVTIIGSTSGAGGVTFINHDEGVLPSRSFIENRIMVCLAGRAAEYLYTGDAGAVTTGASQDITQATRLLQSNMGLFDIGDVGLVDINCFRSTGELMEKVGKLNMQYYNAVVSLFDKNRSTLQALAEELYNKETLYEQEIDAIILGSC